MLEAVHLLYGAVFLGALFLAEGLYFLLLDLRTGGDRGAINRRLRMLAAGESGRVVLLKLQRRRSPTAGTVLERLSAWRALDNAIRMAGLPYTTLSVILACLGVTLMLYALAVTALHAAPPVAIGAAALLGFALPVWLLFRKAGSRTHLFQSQLVEAVEIIVRSLRAGHPVASAVSMVAREMPDPIGSEFGQTFDEMTYGLDLGEALDNLAQRMPSQELRYLIVAIRVQYSTGGNLAEVLGSLAKVLRERGTMLAKVRAFSAEGRLSALILSLLPIVVGLLVNLLNPQYYVGVQDDPLFRMLMGMGVGGMALGILLLRRMVNFRI